MAGIFSRKSIGAILNNEDYTPEERVDQIFSLYGRALDDGYVTKGASKAAIDAAVEEARKGFKAPDPKESEEYKALSSEFDSYKAMQKARTSDDFKGVKDKFFDTVYNKIDRSSTAKPVAEQLAKIKEEYEEYFLAEKKDDPEGGKPQFGAGTQGKMPSGKEVGSFTKAWGYKTRKDD